MVHRLYEIFPKFRLGTIYTLLKEAGFRHEPAVEELLSHRELPMDYLTSYESDDEIASAPAQAFPRAQSLQRKLPPKPRTAAQSNGLEQVKKSENNVSLPPKRPTRNAKRKAAALLAEDSDDSEDIKLTKPKERRLKRGTRPRKDAKYVDSDESQPESASSKSGIVEVPKPVKQKMTAPPRPAPAGKRKRSNSIEPLSDSDVEFVDKKARTGGNSNGRLHSEADKRLLHILNHASAKEISDLSCQPMDIVEPFTTFRPFRILDAARSVQLDSNPKTRKKPQGEKLVNTAQEMLRGYDAIDSLVSRCSTYSQPIVQAVTSWGYDMYGPDASQGRLGLSKLPDADGSSKRKRQGTETGSRFINQPKHLNGELKDYQVVGLNWLHLLWKMGLGCILADDMGLGKTLQILAFLMHLKESGKEKGQGPHLVVGPSSCGPNWVREVTKFCAPFLKAEFYHARATERTEMQLDFEEKMADGELDIVVTTYETAKRDRIWLNKQNFNVAVFDEGHFLKNAFSKRYLELQKIKSKHRIMLTGTPLQNNLRELVSMLAFFMPSVFQEYQEDLNYVFKHKAKTTEDGHEQLLSKGRIEKARGMITPFCLRRKKDQCLEHFVPKTSRVVRCDLTNAQSELYQQAQDEFEEARQAIKNGVKGVQRGNLMSRLRKVAIHGLLERGHFTPDKLEAMTRAYLEVSPKSEYLDVIEDLMWIGQRERNDKEIMDMANQYSWLKKWRLPQSLLWEESGKTQALVETLKEHKKNGDRTLVFSQFTTVLDILEPVLEEHDIKFVRFDGSTDIQERQRLIDEFTEDESITAFFISTRSGGTGINLTAANKVIIFDQSFNPHDDIQAENRAHRVGQTKPVEVIRFLSKGTIEESIHRLGRTKIDLDELVVGEGNRENDLEDVDQSFANDLLRDMDNTAAMKNGDLKNAFASGLEKAGVQLA